MNKKTVSVEPDKLTLRVKDLFANRATQLELICHCLQCFLLKEDYKEK